MSSQYSPQKNNGKTPKNIAPCRIMSIIRIVRGFDRHFVHIRPSFDQHFDRSIQSPLYSLHLPLPHFEPHRNTSILHYDPFYSTMTSPAPPHTCYMFETHAISSLLPSLVIISFYHFDILFALPLRSISFYSNMNKTSFRTIATPSPLVYYFFY